VETPDVLDGGWGRDRWARGETRTAGATDGVTDIAKMRGYGNEAKNKICQWKEFMSCSRLDEHILRWLVLR